jgi:hypothetical protein
MRSDLWVSALIGVGIVVGFVVVWFCAYTAVWIKSIAASLIKMEARRFKMEAHR